MYDSEHSGIRLNGSQFSGLSLESSFRGYLLKEDIEPILDMTECIGFRIYDSIDDDNNPQIFARGVRLNGREIQNIVLQSQLGSDSTKLNGINRASNQGGSRFSAFFSDSMLRILLDQQFPGISFYETRFTDLKQIQVANDRFDGRAGNGDTRGRRTLAAISSDASGFSGPNSLSLLVSDLPSPGYNLKKGIEPGKNLSGIYLFPWD